MFNKSPDFRVGWISRSKQNHAKIELRPLRLFGISVKIKKKFCSFKPKFADKEKLKRLIEKT